MMTHHDDEGAERVQGNGSSVTVEVAGTTEFDAIVMGAGISGLVSASILSDQGSKRAQLVDQYSHVGGKHIDRNNLGYTLDEGRFIFQGDSPLLCHFPELLPLYVPIQPTWGNRTPRE